MPLLFLLFFLTSIGGMAVALYWEYFLFLEPCNLCILQRVALAWVGLISLVAWLHNPKLGGSKVYAFFCLLGAGAGAALAARHVWIQRLPEDQVPECGPDINFLVQALPWKDAIMKVLAGDGNCAEGGNIYLGYTIPELTFVMFASLCVLLLIMLLWPRRKPKPAAQDAGQEPA